MGIIRATHGARGDNPRRPHSNWGLRRTVPLGESPAKNSEKNWMRQIRQDEPERILCLDDLLKLKNSLCIGNFSRAGELLERLASPEMRQQMAGETPGARKLRALLNSLFRDHPQTARTGDRMLALMEEMGTDIARLARKNDLEEGNGRMVREWLSSRRNDSHG